MAFFVLPAKPIAKLLVLADQPAMGELLLIQSNPVDDVIAK